MLVYHTCSIESAIWDLENNKLEARLKNYGDIQTYADFINTDWIGVKFISVTTNSNYVYAKQFSDKKGFIRFILDLDMIEKDGYEIVDFEYFLTEDYKKWKKQTYIDDNFLSKKFGGREHREYEKRILGTVTDFKKYIIGVDFFIEDNTIEEDILKIKGLTNIPITEIVLLNNNYNYGWRFLNDRR